MTLSKLPANYEGRHLDIIVIGGERWAMGPQIGSALGYMIPGKAIRNLYARNRQDFSVDDTMVVEIKDAMGRDQLTRLFSEKGVAKIAMLANTPKAAAFRDWAATVLTTPKEERIALSPAAEPLMLENRPRRWREDMIDLQRELISAQRELLGRKREKKINIPWTAEDDRKLIDLANAGKVDWVRIGEAMGRSRMAVCSRGHILRVKGLIHASA